MNRVFGSFVLLIISFTLSIGNFRFSFASGNNIIFSEISMGTNANASDEFIELYNSSGSDIDISGWQISYKSATGTTWTKKALIDNGKIIPANNYFFLASVIDSDNEMTSGLAQSGGNIRITDKNNNVVDQFAWGNGDKPLVKSAPACQPSESLQRIYNSDGIGLKNTVNNFDDFDISSSPTPGSAPRFNINQEVEDFEQTQNYPQMLISEVYPDPGSDQSDSVDEFIEVYNPNDFEVSLSGWSLRDEGGTNYKLGDINIGPYQYLAFFSKDTPISLNNSGDVVSLYNPANQMVDQTPSYNESQEGLSWGLTPAGWGWTQSPTPNNANNGLFVFSDSSSNKSKSKKTKSSKSTKSKLASSKKSKKPKLASVGKTPSLSAEDNKANSNRNLWNILLIALGLGTIGYGAYEYRAEIKNYYHIVRRKLGFGPKNS